MPLTQPLSHSRRLCGLEFSAAGGELRYGMFTFLTFSLAFRESSLSQASRARGIPTTPCFVFVLGTQAALPHALFSLIVTLNPRLRHEVRRA